MPPRKKYTVADFPPAGTVLSFQLADGRFGACRVLRVSIPETGNAPCALVALSEWIDRQRPQVNRPAVRKILHLTHHTWSNRPEILWFGEPPPPSFEIVGSIPIDKRDAILDAGAYSHWESLPLQRLLQWRWDHDRETLLTEEALEKASEEKKLAASTERRARILATTTLSKIQKRKTLFPRWKNYPNPAAKRAIENCIRAFIAAVSAMKKPTRRDIARELRRCADSLNNYDKQNNHPIETVEREDIFDVMEEILTVAKHPDLIEKLDEWRDW